MSLRQDIEAAINKNSAERGSNTPDFILADFLLASLAAFDTASLRREEWYGAKNSPGSSVSGREYATSPGHMDDCFCKQCEVKK